MTKIRIVLFFLSLILIFSCKKKADDSVLGLDVQPENDMIGLTKGFKPRFLRQYINLYDDILGAAQSYIRDVKANDFPSEKEQY